MIEWNEKLKKVMKINDSKTKVMCLRANCNIN